MKKSFKKNLLILLIFIHQMIVAITFTTNQPGGNSFKNINVEVGKQYQLKFDLLHQSTNNVRIQILEGTSVLVDESNLIDGFHVYAFTPSSTVVTLKFIREDNDNISRDFKVDNLVYEEVSIATIPVVSNHTVGQKEYELTDHLGNVRVVIRDIKVNDSLTVVSAIDYLPFGMEARIYSNGVDVRYGFNGKEDDIEWDKQDYGMRTFDPKLCRFISLDPIARKFAYLTPYQFASNTPILATDLDGLEACVEKTIVDGKVTAIHLVIDVQVINESKGQLTDEEVMMRALEIKKATEATFSGTVQIDGQAVPVTVDVNLTLVPSGSQADFAMVFKPIANDDKDLIGNTAEQGNSGNESANLIEIRTTQIENPDKKGDLLEIDGEYVGTSGAHEIGHALGLGHIKQKIINLMNPANDRNITMQQRVIAADQRLKMINLVDKQHSKSEEKRLKKEAKQKKKDAEKNN
jgi:RHS repeat-associated protein